MWQGQYEHAMDAKGRTSLPSRFRDGLASAGDDRFVLTSSLDPCLVAYPLAEWRAFEEKLSHLPRFDANVVKLRRIYVSAAVETTFDAQGRILIPPALRAYAALEKEVLWAGMGRHAELWAKERWARAVETTEDERMQLATRLSELGL
ncbi:MAG: division/cell wall cluster transcriptional repressor MraZ [Polyangiales bacterium]